MRRALILSLCLLSLSSPLPAAEISNLRTHFSSTQMSIEYDLLGEAGDKDSGVEVILNINGIMYSSHMLTMSGDFGSSIALGNNRRITWMHNQDFPAGLDTRFKCIVNAVPNSNVINEGLTPSEGVKASFYAVNKQTVVETRTKLMWTRNANIATKPMMHPDALKQIEKLNQERYAGYNDWRMPTLEDFEGLVFFGKKAGWGSAFAHFISDYLITCGFTRVQPGNYWTSTTSGREKQQFLAANTWNGMVRPLAGTNYYYLWPVRDAR
jgi:hypothetical protein